MELSRLKLKTSVMEYCHLTIEQQACETSKLNLVKSQIPAIRRAMRDTAVWGEDYFQEGLCLVLEKLKTWNPNKGTLTSYCWLDIRKRFRLIRHKTSVMECQLRDFSLDNMASLVDSTEYQMTLNLFWSKLTPLQKQIVRKRLMGLTQEVIAKTLGLTLRTYKSEVRKIKKLGANS